MRRILLLLPLLLGCAFWRSLVSQSFERPTTEFKEARVTGADLEGAEVELVFAVTNPNGIHLDVAGADFAVDVEGHRVATAKLKSGRILPNATAEVIFPARVHWAALAPSLSALFAQGKVHYRALGQLALQTDVGRAIVPVAHEGTFDAPQMPTFDVGSPSITALSLKGARLSVPLTIRNPNRFALPLRGILGDVSVAGANVGRVALLQDAPVLGGKEATILIPLEVSFLSVGPAAARAIRSGVAQVKIDALLDAAGTTLPVRVAKTVELKRAMSGSAGP